MRIVDILPQTSKALLNCRTESTIFSTVSAFAKRAVLVLGFSTTVTAASATSPHPEPVDAETFIAHAREKIGIPHKRWGGHERDFNVDGDIEALDCSGLILYSLLKARAVNEGFRANAAKLHKLSTKVDRTKIARGMLLFLPDPKRGKRIGHVAIVKWPPTPDKRIPILDSYSGVGGVSTRTVSMNTPGLLVGALPFVKLSSSRELLSHGALNVPEKLGSSRRVSIVIPSGTKVKQPDSEEDALDLKFSKNLILRLSEPPPKSLAISDEFERNSSL